MKVFYLWNIVLLFGTSFLFSQEEEREWTSSDGKTITAQLLSASDESVTLRRSDGRRFDLPQNRLSESDRLYVTRFRKDLERAKGLEEGPFAEQINGAWTQIQSGVFGLPFQLFGTKELRRHKGPFPLFVHLHGAGGRATEVESGNVEIMAKRLAREEQYKKTPCLIAAPLCPPDTFWGSHVEKLEAIIDGLSDALPIDRNRIYLSGYSMGARGIGALLESRPEFYAAAMFADGDANHAWVDSVDTALWLWFSGERDLAKAEAVAKAFSDAGKTAHFEGFEDTTHNQIHWKLAHDEEVYPWIFSQSRAQQSGN